MIRHAPGCGNVVDGNADRMLNLRQPPRPGTPIDRDLSVPVLGLGDVDYKQA
jgi:hypothetical protein